MFRLAFHEDGFVFQLGIFMKTFSFSHDLSWKLASDVLWWNTGLRIISIIIIIIIFYGE